MNAIVNGIKLCGIMQAMEIIKNQRAFIHCHNVGMYFIIISVVYEKTYSYFSKLSLVIIVLSFALTNWCMK